MPNNDHLTALIYLKNKVHKWKNLALLFAAFALIILVKMIFGVGLTGSPIDSDYIANIKIEGVIFEDEFRSEVLAKLAEEKSIKAVIIDINSPGGGIVGSEMLYHDLRKIAANKPIVVVMESVAASGAYMSAIASDYIIAYNGTLTGSIGVIMESPEVTELAQKLGVKLNSFKSSPLKASPSPFEKTSPLVERVIMGSINDSYDFFSGLVKERRGSRLDPKFINDALDGRIFTGRQALKVGLIDQIGGREEALSYLQANKIDIKKLPVHKIEIVEHEDKIFDRLLGFLPFFDGTKNKNSNSKIMAIMQ
ncbi:MAG: signal peptide peptidase SppA [Proteobacteria bacterium]|nr:signal peptide peptidase SppA [Pseudomonadota bacterium]